MPVRSNGAAIEALLDKIGESKADLARGTGYTKTHIGDVIKGKRHASAACRRAIADYLCISVTAIETYVPDEAAS